MSDANSTRQGNSRLRRFVAYSILLHIGAGLAWGLPALLSRMAEQELVKEQEARAKNLEKEEAKAKEFARQQEIEQTRREIEQALRKEFDKLTAALSELKREELWKEVAKLTTPESKNLAEAMGKANTPEQDLRTLEAELQRAMIKNLDEVLTAESARQLADQYLDQVESEVAPGLADAMKAEMEKRVAQKMREEAERLLAKQREDAKRAADQAKNALNEASAKVNAAADATKQADAQLDKAAAQEAAAAKQLGEATAKAGETKAKLDEAGAKAASLEDTAKAAAAAQAGAKQAKAEAEAQNAAAAKQLGEATAKAGEAKAKLDQANAKAASSDAKTQAEGKQAQAQAEAQNAAAAKQLGEATAKAGEAKAKLDEAGAKLASLNDTAKADAAAQAGAKQAKAEAETQNAAAARQLGQATAQQAKAKADAEAQNASAAKQLEQATARLGEAEAKLDEAGARATSLDGKAQEQVAASDRAIATARAATAKAAAAVQGRKSDADAAVTAAQAALAAAQTATKSAIDAVAGQSDRAAVAKAAIHAAVEAEVSAQVGRALTEELTKTTLPRLAGKLQEGFKKELDSKGLSDDALVAQVGKEAQARLAKSVPAMAKAGDAAVDAKFSDMASADAAAAPADGDAAQNAAKKGQAGAANPLDQALAEGLASMAADATKRVGEAAANSSQDGALVAKATRGMNEAGAKAAGSPDGAAKQAAADAAAMASLRDSVGALARSAGNGRINTNTTFAANISALRQASLARGRGTRRDEAAYQEVTGQIAGRTAVQGERWARQGAQGDTAQAAETVGARPAKVVGRAVGAAKPGLANDKAYVPTFKTLAFATVPYGGTTFRIDGKLAKWDALPAIELKPEHGNDRSKQVMKLAWSNAGLFLYCRITDPDRHIDKAEANEFWRADGVEVWIDAFNSKEKYRARHLGQQFWLWPAGSRSDATITGGESVSLGKGGGYRYVSMRTDQLERWATQTAEGWTMEARIPPALITDADLAAGRIVGFNAYVNTMAGTDWYWSAGDKVATSVQPDTWGDLLLAGSDASIEVIAGPAGQADKSKTVLAVGEPLRLRVMDDDMDLDPSARDKIMVTIKDGHGGQQNAVLEETGGSTGVFEGAVTTALALDQPVPAVLSVFEGERVSITYIDQARANGAREAQLSTDVVFGSVVMAAGLSANR